MKRRRVWAVCAAAYVAAVLTVDALGGLRLYLPYDWGVLASADPFKFVAWFVAPLALSLPWLESGWFNTRRWRRGDWWLLAGLALAGAAAVALIPLVPSLRATYGSVSHLALDQKWTILVRGLVWTVSWLLGWEFMHRYFLLRPLSAAWPRFGWLVIPVFEGAYHLTKPPLEMVGMVLFSLVLTYWALKRQNALLPFLAHFIIEIEVIAFRLVF